MKMSSNKRLLSLDITIITLFISRFPKEKERYGKKGNRVPIHKVLYPVVFEEKLRMDRHDTRTYR